MSDTGLPDTLPGFDDPIGLLRACHEKMQSHCELLATLLDKNDLDDEARETARKLPLFFTKRTPASP
jgi:hypothetical protein